MGKGNANIRAILKENVERLAPTHPDGRINKNRLAGDTDIKLGGAQRVLSGTTNVGIDLVQKVAQRYRLAPWQLLVPGLDPAHPPELARPQVLQEPPAQAPYSALSEEERQLGMLFRGMNALHREALLSIARGWFVADNPGRSSSATPFREPAKGRSRI